MKFILIDRISVLERGQRIVAHKALSLAEEYLADHFPAFPVIPGVLMLEAMVQASAWLVRDALGFAPALVLLKEARNVTYKSFVAPGEVLTIESLCKELADGQSELRPRPGGRPRNRLCRLVLRHLNLADSDPALAEIDTKLREHARTLFGLMRVESLAGAVTV